MPDWPLGGASLYADYAVNPTASASANTKGNYSQLLAATPFTASGIIVGVQSPNSGTRSFLIDIAIGAPGAEVVIVSNFHSAYGGTAQGSTPSIYIPISIPAGARIAARCQCSASSGNIWVTVTILANEFTSRVPLGRLITYGAVTADSGGTSIDPGGSINTKGAWVQLAASTTTRIRELAGVFGGQNNSSRAACYWQIDIGIGAALAEQVIIPDLVLSSTNIDDAFCPAAFGVLPVDIPAGTRLVARAACTINDATDRLFDLVLYGAG